MKLLSTEEVGSMFTVRVSITHNWFERNILGYTDRTDLVCFNTLTGKYTCSIPICKGAFEIAMHEYFKKYGTYGKVVK